MANELTILEKQFEPLAPSLSRALAGAMPVEQLLQTILVSVERNPKLLQANRQTLMNAAMTAACLALPVDGVTGQGFLIPFKGRVQFVTGYKGLNTLAARAGLTITGAVVREGDDFDFELGSAGFVRHKPQLGGPDRRIIAAWAVAAAHGRPPVPTVLSIDELLAIKQRAPGAGSAESPWNDPRIGYPAMCEKTAKRRLARSLPLVSPGLGAFHAAARLDEAVDEQGKHAWITPDRGLVIEGAASPLPASEPAAAPTAAQLIKPPASDDLSTTKIPEWDEYVDRWTADLKEATDGGELARTWNSQREKYIRRQIVWPAKGARNGDAFDRLMAAVTNKVKALKEAA